MGSDLTKTELATLKEMRSYSPGPYYFRQATCRRLVARGLAEPTRSDVLRPPHRITEEGRAAISKALSSEVTP